MPLSPFNNTLMELAEWVGDSGLLVVSGGEILYTVSVHSQTFFILFSVGIMLFFVLGCLLLAVSLLTLQFI